MALIHLLSRTEWEQARQGKDSYAPASLASEGFIHLCAPEQLPGVLERYFVGKTDTVALHLDEDKLQGEVRWEDSYGHGLFPHLYAPLNLNAVIDIESV
ncbi:MAG: DUF952 domain-containing protein [Armatimonas sp.]